MKITVIKQASQTKVPKAGFACPWMIDDVPAPQK